MGIDYQHLKTGQYLFSIEHSTSLVQQLQSHLEAKFQQEIKRCFVFVPVLLSLLFDLNKNYKVTIGQSFTKK